LSEDGFDVAVGGVSAYSTLGKFADPVLNTMMRWSDRQLVNTLFHELAHQRLYVKGDTAFNESFATAVANIGSELWQAERGAFAGAGESRDERALQRDMMALVEAAREKLAALYASSLDDETRRQQKRAILDELSAAGAQLAAARGARNWLAAPLNNARLASLGLYEGRHNAFAALYADCDRKLSCFYREAEDLASLAQAERDRRLDALAARFDAGPGGYSAE
jgi:predicted aminopeptidase